MPETQDHQPAVSVSLCHAVRADEAFGTGPKEALTMTAIGSNNQKYLFLIRVDVLRSRE